MKNLLTILFLFISVIGYCQSEGTFTHLNLNGTSGGGFGSSSIRFRIGSGGTAPYYITYAITQQTDTDRFLQINGSNNKGIKIGPTKIWSDLPWAIGAAKVATGYQLSVHGKLICTEAWVRPVANWPDYVFSSEYHLPELSEVEQFIKSNSHLPGVPSAAEVEANNINLGEMNAILLKKIEEITLYLIDANKESVRMKEEISNLQKVNEELRQLIGK